MSFKFLLVGCRTSYANNRNANFGLKPASLSERSVAAPESNPLQKIPDFYQDFLIDGYMAPI
jgi:hypothetical protein